MLFLHQFFSIRGVIGTDGRYYLRRNGGISLAGKGALHFVLYYERTALES